jgi:hypothetical protein
MQYLRFVLIIPSMACFIFVPPEAPSELEDLSTYIFEHVADKNPRELEMGLENLDEWFYTDDNLQQATEGYQVNTLADENIADLDSEDRIIRNNLIGAALSYRHDDSMEELVQTMFVDDWSAVSVDTYEEYIKEFSEDPECLIQRDCDWITYETTNLSNYIIVKIDGTTTGQVRWVETENGWAIVQRTWLREPATVTPDEYDITLHAQYFINITAPSREGDIIRTTATWIDSEYGVIPITEDYAKIMIIQNMEKQNEDIVNWINPE